MRPLNVYMSISYSKATLSINYLDPINDFILLNLDLVPFYYLKKIFIKCPLLGVHSYERLKIRKSFLIKEYPRRMKF